jgi:hypothetical protein
MHKANNASKGLSVGIRIISAHLGGGPDLRINPNCWAVRIWRPGASTRGKGTRETTLAFFSVTAT